MTAKSEFGYGYTQPNVEGKWYNLYHGFMEVRPVTATTSKIYYTLMQDHVATRPTRPRSTRTWPA